MSFSPYLILALPQSLDNSIDMLRTTKKLTHRDFRQRIRRVDPHFYRTGNCVQMDARATRPIGATLLGFGWAYLIITLLQNRPILEASLHKGDLPQDYHAWVMGGLSVFIAASLVMLGAHVMRFLFQNGARKKNSGGILMGSLAAMVMIFTPPSVWQAGFAMLDENSQTFIQSASAKMEIDMPEVNLTQVAFVSSRGN